MNEILRVIAAIAIIGLIIIGLINFNLMVELWVKLIVVVLFIGAIATIVRLLFRGK